MWIATDEGVSRIAGNETQNYQERDGLAYFSTRSLVEDSNGDIWIGTDHGLSHLHGGALCTMRRPLRWPKKRCGRSSRTMMELCGLAPAATDCFATRKAGSSYTTAQGLANNNIYQLLADRRGSLWLSGPTTISSFPLPPQEPDPSDMHLKVNVYELPYDAGPVQMCGGQQPSGSVAPDGDIWFASSRGAVRVLPVPPSAEWTRREH
jgi:ligand-binding sensor domain-containing protein